MKSGPLVSILLPVYNGERTLGSAISSMLEQTLTDIEVLVLDDGSYDGSLEIAKRFSDPRIKVISDGCNLGLSGRLNMGIDIANGRYFARMDQDDISFPERLERQVSFLNDNPEIDLIATRAVTFFGDSGKLLGLLPFIQVHKDLVKYPWKSIPMPHPTWMGRAAWFRRFRYKFPEPFRAEDQELLLRASADSRYHCLDEVLIAYRIDKFDLKKLTAGRISLLREQIYYFSKCKKWVYVLLALSTAASKWIFDLVFHSIGLARWFFARRNESPSDNVLDRAVDLLIRYKSCRVIAPALLHSMDTDSRRATAKHSDLDVVKNFGEEWLRFNQAGLSFSEKRAIFDDYFHLFPWGDIHEESTGADIGCGSGRWASLVAERVDSLICVDASDSALSVAKNELRKFSNVAYINAEVGALPFQDSSLDYAYSLGVLHHVPDTQNALNDIARVLKSNGVFLAYFYYRFDNRPNWFRGLWKMSNIFRVIISKLHSSVRFQLCDLIAITIYWPLAKIAGVLDRHNCMPKNFPLGFYKDKSLYVMRTDALDRFGTTLEKRFSRDEISLMLEISGFTKICFSNREPFWCVVARKR